MASWEDLPLEKQKEKLLFEADWVEKHKKYSTWEVDRDAYNKRINDIDNIIRRKDVGDDVSYLKSYKTKSKLFHSILDEINKARLASSSVTKVKELIQKAYAKQSSLSKAKGSRIQTLDDIKNIEQQNYPKTLENLSNKIKEFKSKWTKQEQELAIKKIKEVLDNGELGMNVPVSAVNDIFNTYFKSQIETGTGKGMVNIQAKKNASKELFGTDTKTTKPHEYEKYGFLMDKNILKQAKSGIADQY